MRCFTFHPRSFSILFKCRKMLVQGKPTNVSFYLYMSSAFHFPPFTYVFSRVRWGVAENLLWITYSGKQIWSPMCKWSYGYSFQCTIHTPQCCDKGETINIGHEMYAECNLQARPLAELRYEQWLNLWVLCEGSRWKISSCVSIFRTSLACLVHVASMVWS